MATYPIEVDRTDAAAPELAPWPVELASRRPKAKARRAAPRRSWMADLLHQLALGDASEAQPPDPAPHAFSPAQAVVLTYPRGVRAAQRRFLQLGQDVARLVDHPDGTYDPIETPAEMLARHVLDQLRAVGNPPTRVVPLADGGLSFQFRGLGTTRYGALTVDNDGDIVAMEIDLSDSAHGAIWLVAPAAVADAAVRLQDFASH